MEIYNIVTLSCTENTELICPVDDLPLESRRHRHEGKISSSLYDLSQLVPSFSLLSSGGILDSQTSDTQFFGFSQSRHDRSPARKKMFRPSKLETKPEKKREQNSPQKHQTAGWQEERKVNVVERVESGPMDPATKLNKGKGPKLPEIDDLEAIEEEDDEELDGRIEKLVLELGRARMHVQTLENEFHLLVSTRYARMKVGDNFIKIYLLTFS